MDEMLQDKVPGAQILAVVARLPQVYPVQVEDLSPGRWWFRSIE